MAARAGLAQPFSATASRRGEKLQLPTSMLRGGGGVMAERLPRIGAPRCTGLRRRVRLEAAFGPETQGFGVITSLIRVQMAVCCARNVRRLEAGPGTSRKP